MCVIAHSVRFVQAPVLIMRYGYTLLPRRLHLPMAHSLKQLRASHRFTSMLALLLTTTILFAVGGMLVWHTYLVLTAQGTVDFYKNQQSAASAARWGQTWQNVHNLGLVRNWQERFDARGRLWMLVWMLPRLSKHRGCGFKLPIAASAQAYLNSHEDV